MNGERTVKDVKARTAIKYLHETFFYYLDTRERKRERKMRRGEREEMRRGETNGSGSESTIWEREWDQV